MPREKKPRLKRRKDGRFKCKFQGVQFYGKTPEEAFALRDAYKESVNKGFGSRTTVIDYSLPWLKRTFPTVANSTYAGLAIHLQHLIDSIGGKRIAEVVPSDIKAVYSTHYAGLSASYTKSARQLYCSLFDSAVADGLCRSNPAREKTAKPHKGNKPKDRVLSPQERYWIETLCTNHRAFPAVMTMLYAGLRPQEVKAIDIDRDVDFINDTITVRMTAHTDAQNAQKYAFSGDGKTELANRSLPLFPPLKQALKGKHGLLITSAHGEPVTKTTWRVAWNSYITEMETAINGIQRRWYGRTKEQKRLATEGKLPAWIDFDIVPYTLRHAFCANVCRDAGVDLNTCRRWLGHADAQMILKVYDSVSEDRADAERKKVENWLIGVQSGVQPEITDRRKVEE